MYVPINNYFLIFTPNSHTDLIKLLMYENQYNYIIIYI